MYYICLKKPNFYDPTMTQTNSADAFNWKRLKQSNPSALGYFYDRYADKLFAAALHMSKDRDVAKDAVQETFIALWSYRNTLGDISHSQGYQIGRAACRERVWKYG